MTVITPCNPLKSSICISPSYEFFYPAGFDALTRTANYALATFYFVNQQKTDWPTDRPFDWPIDYCRRRLVAKTFPESSLISSPRDANLDYRYTPMPVSCSAPGPFEKKLYSRTGDAFSTPFPPAASCGPTLETRIIAIQISRSVPLDRISDATTRGDFLLFIFSNRISIDDVLYFGKFPNASDPTSKKIVRANDL